MINVIQPLHQRLSAVEQFLEPEINHDYPQNRLESISRGALNGFSCGFGVTCKVVDTINDNIFGRAEHVPVNVNHITHGIMCITHQALACVGLVVRGLGVAGAVMIGLVFGLLKAADEGLSWKQSVADKLHQVQDALAEAQAAAQAAQAAEAKVAEAKVASCALTDIVMANVVAKAKIAEAQIAAVVARIAAAQAKDKYEIFMLCSSYVPKGLTS